MGFCCCVVQHIETQTSRYIQFLVAIVDGTSETREDVESSQSNNVDGQDKQSAGGQTRTMKASRVINAKLR